MSRGVNKVILIGNVGQNPDVKVQQGFTVANLSIATSESWKDKNTGEKKESAEWHRVVVYNKLAEIVGEYVKKGSKIYIEGKLQTRKWQDKDTGQDRYSTEIVCSTMEMLDSKGSSSEGYRPDVDRSHPPANGQEDLDDEIPF